MMIMIVMTKIISMACFESLLSSFCHHYSCVGHYQPVVVSILLLISAIINRMFLAVAIHITA